MATVAPAKKDPAWHDGEGGAASLSDTVKRLEQRLSVDRFLDGCLTRLYFGEPLMGTGTTSDVGVTGVRASAYLSGFDGRTQENLVKQVLDACAASVVRKPAVKVVTTGAKWSKSVSARKLSRLVSGIFSSSGFLEAVAPTFLDSCRTQVAAVKWEVDPDTGEVTCERALPHTIVFDPAAGPKPRQLFQRHGVPRGVLAARYPEHAEKIWKLPAYRPPYDMGPMAYETDADQVEVCEGWRLTKGKDEGRHVLTAGQLVLVDEEWDLGVFPLVVLTFGESYSSLAGDPLARQVLPYQLRLTRVNRQIEENAQKCANPKIAIPKGSELVPSEFTNTMAERFYYNSAAGRVEWLKGEMLPPQFYAERDYCKDSAFAAGGVSRNIAEGTKPAGLNSGRAIRDAADQAAGRLVLIAEKLERWFEANASVCVGLMRMAYGTKSQRIRAPNTSMLEEIDWTEVGDLKEDEIEVRCFITSAIPQTPAGRAETLAEWVEAGVISQRRAARWYANPDTAEIEDEESALEDLARKMIDSALYDCKWVAPEPVMGPEGLGLLSDLAGRALMSSLVLPDPPPAANQELLRRLIEEAQSLSSPPANTNAAPPAAPPGPPGPPPPGVEAPPAQAAAAPLLAS
jgi:hypothetical protein